MWMNYVLGRRTRTSSQHDGRYVVAWVAVGAGRSWVTWEREWMLPCS